MTTTHRPLWKIAEERDAAYADRGLAFNTCRIVGRKLRDDDLFVESDARYNALAAEHRDAITSNR
jgi:hypothetical protein